MSKMRISRRAMLRGVLGGGLVTVGLPPLDIFFDTNGTAHADGTALPRRFGLCMWGSGMIPHRWVPRGVGTDYEFSEQLAPLAGLRDHISVLTGYEVKTPNTIPHYSGASGILTGRPLLDRGDFVGTFPVASIDQVIAAEIGNDTRFRSIEFGAAPDFGLSYNGPDSLNPPESSPRALFDRIFFREPVEEVEVDPRLALRRSVLDVVMDDARRLQGQLGTTDQARLEQHLQGIRDLELRIARLEEDQPTLLEACIRPDEPLDEYPDIGGRGQIAEKTLAMGEIIAMALACDQTRVFSNFITSPVANELFDGIPIGIHRLTHDEPGQQPLVNDIVTRLIGVVAGFLEKLRDIPEGDGSLLDNCGVLVTSDVSWGKAHGMNEFPLVIAGSACGRLQMGMHHRSDHDNASKVPLTMIRAMGIDQAAFGGDDGYTEDSVGELEA
jgi:hypothetical protein